MGLAAADMVISHNWESTACAYLTYCEEVISKKLQNRSYICKAWAIVVGMSVTNPDQ